MRRSVTSSVIWVKVRTFFFLSQQEKENKSERQKALYWRKGGRCVGVGGGEQQIQISAVCFTPEKISMNHTTAEDSLMTTPCFPSFFFLFFFCEGAVGLKQI